ncbi:MAG: hypothetical protein M1833_003548 [Piccolia ochrophora]|nr:MAG: hypothetical protein M1833_003548 [Piccolia ochrophora]
MLTRYAVLLSALALCSSITIAQDTSANSNEDTKVGYSGTLSSLDGGLQGTVKVVDSDTLEISDYELEEASAPALYWWGSTDDSLENGFRISNTQVSEASTGDSLEIKLDAGKSTADFSTVGLWCERFSVNFGQTTLEAGGAESSAASSATESNTSSAVDSPPTGGSAKRFIASRSVMAAGLAAAVGYTAFMV